jgi:integrase
MIQLSEMITFGTISDRHLYQNRSLYKKIPKNLKIQLDDYLDSCQQQYSKRSWNLARTYGSEIMLFFNDFGYSSVEQLTYQDVLKFYNTDLFYSNNTKSIIFGHMRRMLNFFSEKGLCHKGYSLLLDSQIYPYVADITAFSQENQVGLEELRVNSFNVSTNDFYERIDDFIDVLKSYRYATTTLNVARHSLTALYLFLDIHDLGYCPDICWIWFSEIKTTIGNSWRSWRRVLKCFEEYAITGSISPSKKYSYGLSSLELLPKWCEIEIIAFLKQKSREFRRPETVRISQYPCIRFCRYLIQCNILKFSDITFNIINEFNCSDWHATFRGRASYAMIIRQFLEYLEEKNLIKNKQLHLSLSPGTAPIEKTIDVLKDNQVNQIADYEISHHQPIELRNIAVVLIGLKMGFRASDVVNLKLCDIDWKNKQIVIIQQKTQVQLRLPMPVEVGNAIFLYLKDGRPKSDDKHIFLRHKAPYGKLTTKNCTLALYSILPERKATPGGFHVTRRTFATRLLNNGSSLDLVIDSLGHQNDSSVMSYLSLDEKRTRSCALSLFETGLLLKKEGLL